MAITAKQLSQVRPANTNAVSVYSPELSVTTKIKTIKICNTTSSNATYRIFHDNNGTTYDESTALYFDVNLSGKATDLLTGDDYLIVMNDNTGNLAVRTGTASALTFTVYGEEEEK